MKVESVKGIDFNGSGEASDSETDEPRDNLDLEKELLDNFGPRELWSDPPDPETDWPPSPTVEAQRRSRWGKLGPKVSARWGAKKCGQCHRIIHDIRCIHYEACPFCDERGCAGNCSERAKWSHIPAGGEEDEDDHSLPLASDDE